MKDLFSNRIAKRKRQLENANNYTQWKEIAQELDELENKTRWKNSFASDIYNYELLSDRLKELQTCREAGKVDDLARALREGLHHDLGNMGDERLYRHCYFGTKRLIEQYVDEVCRSVQMVSENDITGMTATQKLDFFKDILLSYGRPSLLLSGGASLGVFHVGVVKALWEKDLLPQVITGSSAGSIIAATLGTHTDEELPEFFDPESHSMKAWKWAGFTNGLSGKGFMDQAQLRDYIRSYVGEYTMQEAYERTGRSVNISVSPVQHHQKARLLSGYTSPYILLWSAALASCAVPTVFPPVKLLKKDQHGHNVPYMPRLRWVDGSVVSDLPVERLMHLYDVNYSIVSQTNPHVVPFLDTDKNKPNEGLLSLPMRAIMSELKFHGKSICDYVRKHADSEVVRQASGKLYSMMSQNYYGDVTIAPKYTLRHYAKVLSNPDTKMIRELMLAGERATWPKISMIRTHSQISKTLENCIRNQKHNVRSHKAQLKVIGNK